MARPAASIQLSGEEESTLRGWTRAGTAGHRKVERARIILLASEGQSTDEIAKTLKTRAARVSKWRRRFALFRLNGLQDSFRPGKPASYDANTEKRILSLLNEPPPDGYA